MFEVDNLENRHLHGINKISATLLQLGKSGSYAQLHPQETSYPVLLPISRGNSLPSSMLTIVVKRL